MPSPKCYESNAERQAAYRARHPELQPPTEAQLAILARSLHAVFAQAVAEDVSLLPVTLLGTRADETLRHLIRYLDPHPDPIRDR